MKLGLMQFPVLILNQFGLFRFKNKITSHIVILYAYLAMSCFVEVVTLIQYKYLPKGNVSELISNSEALGGYYQIITKTFYCLYYQDKFVNLLKLSKQFWSAENCTKKTRREINDIVGYTNFFQKFFTFWFTSLVTLLILSTFVMERKLLIGTWKLNDATVFKAVWLFQSCSLFGAAFHVSAFDGLFIGICMELRIQFKILCDQLQKMNALVIFEERLRTNVKHHQFLLSYLDKFQDCYSIILMLHFTSVAPLMCIEIYAVIDSSDPGLAFRYAVSAIAVVLQISLYCIPMELLSKEVSEISNALYNTNWYLKNCKFTRMPVQFIMQIAQKELRFQACGLIDINVKTLLSVFRVAISSSTIFRHMKNR